MASYIGHATQCICDDILTGPDEARAVPQQDRSRQMVSRIIDATVRLIEQHGPTGLSTNAVAFAANISVGSLYRYFPNKDALILAAVEREGRRLHASIRSRVGSGACKSTAQVVGNVVEATLTAYKVINVDDVLAAFELRRANVFDRRVGARTAIAAELMAGLTEAAGHNAEHIANAAPIVAEIVVALVEAATARPTAILHVDNVVSVACAISIRYIEAPCEQQAYPLAF